MDWSQLFGSEWIAIILASAILFAIAEITEKKQWKRVLLYLVYWTWCFPQTFIGFIWFLICKIRGFKSSEYKSHTVWTGDPKYSPAGGVSMGMFIFGIERKGRTELTKAHEYGHTLQSLILGWFYPIVIGLPGVIWLFIYQKLGKSYYWFYTESWAEKLGKVEREK